jgi:NADPH:quinone reductase-like Zn-dependent oxidoreductase
VPPASVLIEVRAAGVNPVDWKLVGGHLDPVMPTQFPVTPGWDVAGVVVGLGFDTPEFSIGDEVVAYARKDVLGGGTFAEKVAVPVRAVAPEAEEPELGAGGRTAVGRRHRSADPRVPRRSGGPHRAHPRCVRGSGQLRRADRPKAAGARVIGTASEANHEYLRGLGAEPVTYGDGLVERVLEAADGKVDGVADFVGGVLDDTLAVLTEGGPPRLGGRSQRR